MRSRSISCFAQWTQQRLGNEDVRSACVGFGRRDAYVEVATAHIESSVHAAFAVFRDFCPRESSIVREAIGALK